jgi:hypothetical protein
MIDVSKKMGIDRLTRPRADLQIERRPMPKRVLSTSSNRHKKSRRLVPKAVQAVLQLFDARERPILEQETHVLNSHHSLLILQLS